MVHETGERARPEGTQRGARTPVARGPASAAVPRSIARDVAFAALLFAVLLLVYAPALRGSFLLNDDAHVTRPELRSWQGLGRIWTEPGVTQQYYPLLDTFFWIEHRLWGDATLGYHLVNLLLHAGATFLVLRVLRALAIPGAELATALFALHPVQVESVAWISQQKNTLSAVLGLASALAYLRFDQTRARASWALALAWFVLSLLAKPVTATLPALLLIVLWWRNGRWSWRRDVVPLAPFFGFGLASGWFTAWFERVLVGAHGPDYDLAPVERILVAGRALWFYLAKLVWPAGLSFIYPRWHVSAAEAWQFLFPAAAVLVLTFLAVLARRWRGPLAGALVFVVSLLPLIGFFNAHLFVCTFVADHFQYLACLGVLVPATAGLVAVAERAGLSRAPVRGLALGLGTLLAVLTWRQSRAYVDDETQYQAVLARNPECWVAENNLGLALVRRGELDQASPHFARALEIRPDFPDALSNVGSCLAARGRFEEAEARFARALELDPDDRDYRDNLEGARRDARIAACERAVGEHPGEPDAYVDSAEALEQAGRARDAVQRLWRAIELAPDAVRALDDLAWLLAILPPEEGGDPARAEALEQHACALTGHASARRLDTIADAYAGEGRLPEAVEAAERALVLAQEPALAQVVEDHLRLFRAGGVYRERPASGRPIGVRP